MEQEPDSLEHKKAILEYWTLVEFFSPYILENALEIRSTNRLVFLVLSSFSDHGL